MIRRKLLCKPRGLTRVRSLGYMGRVQTSVESTKNDSYIIDMKLLHKFLFGNFVLCSVHKLNPNTVYEHSFLALSGINKGF